MQVFVPDRQTIFLYLRAWFFRRRQGKLKSVRGVRRLGHEALHRCRAILKRAVVVWRMRRWAWPETGAATSQSECRIPPPLRIACGLEAPHHNVPASVALPNTLPFIAFTTSSRVAPRGSSKRPLSAYSLKVHVVPDFDGPL